MNPIQNLKQFIKKEEGDYAFLALPDNMFSTIALACILDRNWADAYDKAKVQKNTGVSFKIGEMECMAVYADDTNFASYEGLEGAIKLSVELGTRVIVFGESVDDTILGNLHLTCRAAWFGRIGPWKHHHDVLHLYRTTIPGYDSAQAVIR